MYTQNIQMDAKEREKEIYGDFFFLSYVANRYGFIDETAILVRGVIIFTVRVRTARGQETIYIPNQLSSTRPCQRFLSIFYCFASRASASLKYENESSLLTANVLNGAKIISHFVVRPRKEKPS